jgi:hypothetical protein
MAEEIAGVSSIDELPPAVGVHAALRFRAELGPCWTLDGRAQPSPTVDNTDKYFNIDIFDGRILERITFQYLKTCSNIRNRSPYRYFFSFVW